MTDTSASSTFSPTEAALEGFRIAREKPRVMLGWAALNLIISIVMAVVLVVTFGPALADLEAMSQQEVEDPAQALALLRTLGPLYAVLVPAGLIFIAVTSAAVYRIVLRLGEGGFAYLRLGGDELRLVLLMVVILLLAIVFTFAWSLVVGLLAALLAALFSAGGSDAGAVVAGLIGPLTVVATLAGIIFFSVRFSLAGPMTFAEGRLRVFESWKLTRGHFWRLFGAYALALALLVVMLLLMLIIYGAVAAIAVGGDLAQVGRVFAPDTTSLGAYFSVPMIVYLLFGAVMSAVQTAVLYSPSAVAYRELTFHGRANDFD